MQLIHDAKAAAREVATTEGLDGLTLAEVARRVGVTSPAHLDLLAAEAHLIAIRPGQTLIGDKNYFGRDFEQELAQQGDQRVV